MKPRAEQALQIKSALEAGRSGAASLSVLAAAYDLACSPDLTSCRNELRQMMLDKLRPNASSTARDVLIGIASGTITHVMLGSR